MKKTSRLFILLLASATTAFAQTDTTRQEKQFSIFDKLTQAVKEYKPDTAAPPADKITRKIMELRSLRGGFNINEVVDYKLEEDHQKAGVAGPEFTRFSSFMRSGNGKKWVDNAVIWIYRERFTYKELKQLVKFYRTAAGQKMAEEFPVIMLRSLVAAETIKDVYTKQQEKR